jgi:hypothetical protein
MAIKGTRGEEEEEDEEKGLSRKVYIILLDQKHSGEDIAQKSAL